MRSIQCGMASLAGAALVWGSLLPAQARAEGSGTDAELPYRVREILQRHCLECHGDTSKGGVRILDRALLVQQRQVVRPGSPETSELLDLVAGGSMPPGNRPKVPAEEWAILQNWIRVGAPAFPGDADESYVLWSIVRNFRTLADKQKPFVRYFSLNHLLARDRTVLSQERKALREMLRYLTAEGKPAPELQSIESTDTVFRIDLRDLGWHRQPYKNEPLNLFDLALLEYPHGRLPIQSPFYAELLRFLRVARQIRPVPYLRADWLVRNVSRPPLHSDFLKVLQKPLDSKPPGAGLSRLDLLGRDLQDGIPIVPLDGLTYHPKPSSDIEFRAIDAIDFEQHRNADPLAKDTFAPEDQLILWIKSKRGSVVEVIHTDKVGRKKIPKEKIYEIEAGKVLPLGPIKMRLAADEQQDSEDYTIYAYPREDPKARNANFPNGKLLQAKGLGINDRVVHPLYGLRPDGRGFEQPDAGKMVKMTIRIKTHRPTKD